MKLASRRPLPIALVLLSLAVLVGLRLGGPADPVGTESEPLAATADYETVVPADEIVAPEPTGEFQVVRATLGRGTTLSATLGRIGIPADERQAVIRAVGRYLDLRRLPPETGLAAVNRDGQPPHTLALRTEPSRFLRLTLADDDEPGSVRAELIKLPLVTTVETAGGVVRSSVAQALAGSDHGLPLTLAFADILQWDVDLLIDPRPGDAVRMVYEAERLGAPPEDLPRFRNAAMRAGEFVRLGRILAASYDGRMARSAGFWLDGQEGSGSYFDAAGQPLRKAFLKSPLNYRRISSRFSNSRRHPVTRKVVPHHGIDFAADSGTPVVATSDGRVVSAGNEGPLGRAVRVRHGSEFVTVYGHLSGFARGIRSGVEVQQNQIIGYVGSTGRATGPHLHYTMIRSGRAVDPFRVVNPPADPLPEESLPRLASAMKRWLPRMQEIPLGADAFEIARGSRTADVATGM